jgi:hypothetical protein
LTLEALYTPTALSFTHRALYDHAPEIEVEIAATSPGGVLRGRPIETHMLMDSGADYSMIDDSYARHLGIDLNQCPVRPVRGITGVSEARLSRLNIYVCGSWLEVPVLFAPDRWPQLLGRRGVFDNLFVAFVHGARMLFASEV